MTILSERNTFRSKKNPNRFYLRVEEAIVFSENDAFGGMGKN